MHYKNTYRIESARLEKWDYSTPGYYYVTICVQNKQQHFGSITQGAMIFSNNGGIAEKHWRDIPNRYPFSRLDEFVIMPNHVHGIIQIIDHPQSRVGGICVGDSSDGRCMDQCTNAITADQPSHKRRVPNINPAMILPG